MTTRTLLPVLIVIAAIGAPRLLASTPVDPQKQVSDTARCATAEPGEVKTQAKPRALTGLARNLAGNLPMIGRGGIAASASHQAISATIDGVAMADTARAPTCAA